MSGDEQFDLELAQLDADVRAALAAVQDGPRLAELAEGMWVRHHGRTWRAAQCGSPDPLGVFLPGQ